MKREGPPLEALMDRLAAIPPDYLKKYSSSPEDTGGIYLPALLNDLLVDTGDSPLVQEETVKLEKAAAGKNHHQLAGIFCHIYHDPFFTKNKVQPHLIRDMLLSPRLATLAETAVNPDMFINDPDRREEICRLALETAGFFPAGEDEKISREKLISLDSIERKKILDKTRDAQKRAREIREAMLRQEAEEAASKMSRE